MRVYVYVCGTTRKVFDDFFFLSPFSLTLLSCSELIFHTRLLISFTEQGRCCWNLSAYIQYLLKPYIYYLYICFIGFAIFSQRQLCEFIFQSIWYVVLMRDNSTWSKRRMTKDTNHVNKHRHIMSSCAGCIFASFLCICVLGVLVSYSKWINSQSIEHIGGTRSINSDHKLGNVVRGIILYIFLCTSIFLKGWLRCMTIFYGTSVFTKSIELRAIISDDLFSYQLCILPQKHTWSHALEVNPQFSFKSKYKYLKSISIADGNAANHDGIKNTCWFVWTLHLLNHYRFYEQHLSEQKQKRFIHIVIFTSTV